MSLSDAIDELVTIAQASPRDHRHPFEFFDLPMQHRQHYNVHVNCLVG